MLGNGQSRELATLGIQDIKQNKKHNTICVGHHLMQANIKNEPSNKQLEVKTNQTIPMITVCLLSIQGRQIYIYMSKILKV